VGVASELHKLRFPVASVHTQLEVTINKFNAARSMISAVQDQFFQADLNKAMQELVDSFGLEKEGVARYTNEKQTLIAQFREKMSNVELDWVDVSGALLAMTAKCALGLKQLAQGWSATPRTDCDAISYLASVSQLALLSGKESVDIVDHKQLGETVGGSVICLESSKEDAVLHLRFAFEQAVAENLAGWVAQRAAKLQKLHRVFAADAGKDVEEAEQVVKELLRTGWEEDEGKWLSEVAEIQPKMLPAITKLKKAISATKTKLKNVHPHLLQMCGALGIAKATWCLSKAQVDRFAIITALGSPLITNPVKGKDRM